MDDEIFGGNNNNETDNQVPQTDEVNNGEVNNVPENNAQDNANENNSSQPYSMPNYNQYGNNGYQQNNQQYSQHSPYEQQYQYNNNQSNNYGGYPPYNGNYNQPPQKIKSNGTKIFIGIILAIVILSLGLMIAIFSMSTDNNTSNTTSENVTSENEANNSNSSVNDLNVSSSSLKAGEAAVVAEIAQKYNVGILIYKNNALYTEGSGAVVTEDEDGKYTYIVTCAHVVNYSGVAVSVLMSDGTEYPADVVGLDTRTDIAVVRIEAKGLTKAEFADSDELTVGQTVYAVGNPGGSEFFGSISNGIISAIDRPVSSSTGYEMECIQHTAAINPGNSGGALVNGEGKIIGINSMKIASTEYEGMGFSVPSNVVIEVFNSIIKNGYVAGRAKLGISYTTPSGYSQTYAMYVQMKGLPSGTIVIADISSDSDLASKDIKVGDMITKVNGKSMTDSGMLSDMIEDMSVGDTLKLTIVRVNTDNWSQTEFNVEVKLVEDKNTTAQSTDDDSNSSSQGNQNPYGNSGNSSNDLYEFFKEYYGF